VLKVALFGLGKMGLSHQAIINSHRDVELVAVCDTAAYVLDAVRKYTGVRVYSNSAELLRQEKLDAAFIATPPRLHAEMVRACLDRDLHVFCEKPFCLDPEEGLRLAELAEGRGRVNQVGYHHRFVAAFEEMKRIIDLGLVGRIHNIRAEVYGPVVLRTKGASWRSSQKEGGGCLYDYASHAIDLMNYMVGRPRRIGYSTLNRVFSSDVEDEVYSTFVYENGATGQLLANWSDESNRKMSTKISVWGTNGKIYADRQELQLYLRQGAGAPDGFRAGWNVRYVTDLAEPVSYYLRGEEYSAQIAHFVQAIKEGSRNTRCTFRMAVDADCVAAGIVRAGSLPTIDLLSDGAGSARQAAAVHSPARVSLWSRLRR
jgi:scyllo-inositol 2-dehydrogenase (NADP+)